MHDGVFITCAVTGSGTPLTSQTRVPVTPNRLPRCCIEAAKAGAAIVHIHVREDDGMPSRDVGKYAEVVERVRASDTDVVINLTAGMGGDLVLGGSRHHCPRQRAPTWPAPPNGWNTCVNSARDLHARLRHHELRRGRLRHDQHAEPARRDGEADDQHRHADRDRGIRHRASGTRQEPCRAGLIPDPVMVQLCMGFRGVRPMTSTPSWPCATTSRRLDVLGVLDRAQPAEVRLAGGHGWRQRASWPRRQSSTWTAVCWRSTVTSSNGQHHSCGAELPHPDTQRQVRRICSSPNMADARTTTYTPIGGRGCRLRCHRRRLGIADVAQGRRRSGELILRRRRTGSGTRFWRTLLRRTTTWA